MDVHIGSMPPGNTVEILCIVAISRSATMSGNTAFSQITLGNLFKITWPLIILLTEMGLKSVTALHLSLHFGNCDLLAYSLFSVLTWDFPDNLTLDLRLASEDLIPA